MRGSRRNFGLVHAMILAAALGCGKRETGDAPRSDSVRTAGPAIAPAADSATTVPDTAATPDSAASKAADTSSATLKSKGATTRGETPKKTVATPRPAAKPKPSPKPAAAAPAATPVDTPPSKPAAQAADTAAASTQANAPLRDPYHQAPLDTVSQQVYDGWKQFNLNCARCHGEDVQGTTIAPHLILSLKPDGPINTKELFVQTVCAGRPAKGMPAWCALGMEMDKIQAIYSYVKGRSDGKIHPGRPAVKAAD
jgi:mono/diheme cytochrome c family protein